MEIFPYVAQGQSAISSAIRRDRLDGNDGRVRRPQCGTNRREAGRTAETGKPEEKR